MEKEKENRRALALMDKPISLRLIQWLLAIFLLVNSFGKLFTMPLLPNSYC
jgi:hypothetical protein